ncbi:hypothetical protein PENTCL1PPCAC_19759, partial [Pristionchus entomophagus]
MKPTFLSGFLPASPKKNTSPNESYNSILNLYAPKKNACSPPWYEERVKLATLHFNTLSILNMLNLLEERYDTPVAAIGRESRAVKRKTAKVDHAWRKEVWQAIPGVIDGRLLQQYMKRIKAPSNQAYVQAMENEEEEEEEEGEREGEEGDGGESDVSVELGGGMYGEEVDSDHEPAMNVVELSNVEDEKSEEEGSVEGEGERLAFSGSDWDEGEAAVRAMEAAARGRGKGRGRGGRGGRSRGRGGVVLQLLAKADQDIASAPAHDAHPSTEEQKGEGRAKKLVKRVKKEKKDDSDQNSDLDYEPTPAKKGKGKGK